MDLFEQLYTMSPLYKELFKEQLEFCLLPSRFTAALCSRRAGKTTVVAVKIVQALLDTPKTMGMYLALTNESVKDIFMPVLRPLLLKYKIKCKITTDSVTFLNGSKLLLLGANHVHKIESFRGVKLQLCIIDEAASFKEKLLGYLVDQIIKPALMDLQGQLILIGTPASHCSGLFHKITTSDASVWLIRRWTARENPYTREQFLLDQKLYFEEHKCDETDPAYRREQLGEWCADEGGLMIRWPKFALPPYYTPDTCRSVIGVDFGYNDETAFVVLGWQNRNKTTYVYESSGKSGMTVTEIGDKLKELVLIYRPIVIVADPAGSGKILIEEFARKQGVPIKASKKHNKADYVEILNDAIVQGSIILNHKTTGKLQEQIKNVVWNEERTREHEGLECDHIDAFLYAFRESLSFLEKTIVPNKDKTHAEISREMIEKQIRDDSRRRSNDEFNSNLMNTIRNNLPI